MYLVQIPLQNKSSSHGMIMGKVMRQNDCHAVAPSTVADSYIDLGILLSPTNMTMKPSPMVNKDMMMIAAWAVSGLASQSKPVRPMDSRRLFSGP